MTAHTVNTRAKLRPASLCCFLTAWMLIGGSLAAGAPPNVILVITDDQGYGDLSCHGHPVLETPHLDRLHDQSVRLTDFHVSPTCSQTRASLLTGQYNNRVRVWHTIMGRSLLRADATTLANLFAANGYRTGIFGKWHLGDNYPFRPQDRGFQESLVHKGGGVGNIQDYWGNDYFDDTFFRNGTPEKQTGYCTDVWFRAAIEFIEQNRSRPFFCYLSTNAPHGPFRVPERYAQPFLDRGVDASIARFFGMIANIDENFGRLEEKLREWDIADSTIMIFMTDNGGVDSRRAPDDYNAGLRGWKGSHYDGGHRVPFFVRWKQGGIGGGTDLDLLTAHIDVLPTLAELCELELPSDIVIDGRSFARRLTDATVDWPERTLFVDNQRIDQIVKGRRTAVMTERWRLVDGAELFDIQADRSQQRDVAAQHPDVVTTLSAAFESWWEDVSRDADQYDRTVIGSEHEPTVCLTSHDIHGQVIFDQTQVRRGQVSDGFWAIEVAVPGTYEFELRRWPREANLGLCDARPRHEQDHITTDLRALHFTQARLSVGNHDISQPVDCEALGATFVVDLPAGPTRLQAWLIDGGRNGTVRGAYYVYARRLQHTASN